MKKILFLFVLVFVFPLSCSDDDNVRLDCNKYCEKATKCDEEMTAEEKSNCNQFCNNLNEKGYFDKNYLKNINECLDNDDCAKIESCVEESQSKCPAIDGSKYYETICNKMLECKATTKTKEECIEEQKKENNDFSCTTEKYVSDMTDCVSKVSCDKYMEDMMNCMLLIFQ